MSNDNTPSPLTFDAALAAFVDKLNAVHAAANAEMGARNPAMADYYKPITLEAGSKNIRVVHQSAGSRSVYCFVEKGTGSVLKAAGWRQPAKGSRGNIFNPESYAKADPYGSWLYLR
jgi:hypothetical protein